MSASLFEHGRDGRDIRPELYDLRLDCLLQAVKEFDDRCSDEVEAAWRHVMQEGVEFLKTRYDRLAPAGSSPV